MGVASILASVSYLFSFALVILFGQKNYEAFYHKKYSFMNCFPYEMNDKRRMPINNYFRLVVVLMITSALFLEISLLSTIHNISHILLLIISIFASLFLMTLFFISMQRIEVHMAVVTLAYSFSILTFIAFGYYLYMTPFYIQGRWIYIIISLALALMEIIIIFSPKITNWAKLEKKEGQEEYSRPTFVALASAEWLLFVFQGLYLILLILSVSI